MQPGAVLDSQFACCDLTRSHVDNCGICDGDSTACAAVLKLDLLLDPKSTAPLEAAVVALLQQGDGGLDERDISVLPVEVRPRDARQDDGGEGPREGEASVRCLPLGDFWAK